MQLFPEGVVLPDTPAGREHFGRVVADSIYCASGITDSSYNALSVAKESATPAHQLGYIFVIRALAPIITKMGRRPVAIFFFIRQ
ncbi:MAG: hypothetical protein M0Q91_01690 [Methanoregula sp.]|jgi:CO dehydrogenase nickel-insertion accessory protein CooC1|nr:hypothetical protein [Methanoregula sp.]